MNNFVIREYKDEDKPGVEYCIARLQDLEHELEEDRFEGEKVSKTYLDFITGKCNERSGKIFVAEHEGQIAGFCCIWIENEPEDGISAIKDYAYFSDSFVMPEHRGKGVGTRFIEIREEYAKSLGLKYIKVDTLYGNANMREFIKGRGFRDYSVTFIKKINR